MYIITIITTLVTFKYANCLHAFGFHYRNIQHVELDYSIVSEEWIDQPIDHFTPGSDRFKMRYFQRLDLWKPNGPVYIVLSGEEPADPSQIQSSNAVTTQLARETNGALFVMEHRFYGESVPANPMTVLQFLSSLQALEDLAYFIKYLKSTRQFLYSKVVVLGCSYSGNLAAWARLRHPRLVDAALASSAPVLAKTDFYEYLETVNDVFKQYGTPGCLEKIQQIFSRYRELLKTPIGRIQLQREFNIDIDLSRLENQKFFLYSAISIYMGKVQYGTPYEINEHCVNISQTNVMPVPSFPFMMGNNLDFRSSLRSMMTLSTDPRTTMWSYQTCTEFGYFKTTSSKKQPFGHFTEVDYFVKNDCTRLFGSQFNKDRVEQGVASTNSLYGGLRPNVTNVIFTHGDMDPWHRLGVVASQSDSVIAITTPGTSHCAIMFRDMLENPKLTHDRQYVKYVIKKWIA